MRAWEETATAPRGLGKRDADWSPFQAFPFPRPWGSERSQSSLHHHLYFTLHHLISRQPDRAGMPRRIGDPFGPAAAADGYSNIRNIIYGPANRLMSRHRVGGVGGLQINEGECKADLSNSMYNPLQADCLCRRDTPLYNMTWTRARPTTASAPPKNNSNASGPAPAESASLRAALQNTTVGV